VQNVRQITRTLKNIAKQRIFGCFSLYIAGYVPYHEDVLECGHAPRPNKYRVSEYTRIRYKAHSLQVQRNVLKKETGGLMATTRMTQTQLVRQLAEAGEVTNKQSRAILDTLSSLAISEVKKNGVFVLPGIGRLVRVDRKARMGRNPATGAAIKIPAKKVVKFRVAKAAKDAIVPPKKK
jgi:DNA-binding protein HU-beta